MRPPQRCLARGCRDLILYGSYCAAHKHLATGSRGSTRAWRTLRLEILERDHYTCQIRLPGCKVRATHVDHRIGKRQGGTDDPTNLRAACASCNLKRAPAQASGSDGLST